MTMNCPVIAIDGTAASGKGTLARRLGSALGFNVMDTGALYRLVAFRLMEAGWNGQDQATAVKSAQSLNTDFKPSDTSNPQIRTDEVGQIASVVAAIPEVRAVLLDLQHNFARNPGLLESGEEAKGAILDGRDIGTVVCPDADAKLFVTASTEIRAKRRHKELQSAGFAVTYEAVLADMQARDARDSARKTAPMKAADDALLLDTSAMTIEEVFEKAKAFITKQLNGRL